MEQAVHIKQPASEGPKPDFLNEGRSMAAASNAIVEPTIFHEKWWMNAASNGAYREAISMSGGQIAGRLPYVIRRGKGGVKFVGMPLMSHVLGPAFAPQFATSSFPKSLKQLSITRDLLRQLPAASHISFRLHGGLTDTLAFSEAGYANQADFTVEIASDAPDVLWRNMRDKTRNVIRRAEERLNVGDMLDPHEFLTFYDDNLHGRGLKNHYDRDIACTLLEECVRRARGRILTAVDAAGNPQAAIFTIWDRTTEYYFMSTRRADSMNGATSLLIWFAMQHAASERIAFDMDFIHTKNGHLPNLHLLTGFGGVIRPRYVVRRTAPLLEIARQARALLIGP